MNISRDEGIDAYGFFLGGGPPEEHVPAPTAAAQAASLQAETLTMKEHWAWWLNSFQEYRSLLRCANDERCGVVVPSHQAPADLESASYVNDSPVPSLLQPFGTRHLPSASTVMTPPAEVTTSTRSVAALQHDYHLRWWRWLYVWGGVCWPPLRRLVWGFLSGAMQCPPEQYAADRAWYEKQVRLLTERDRAGSTVVAEEEAEGDPKANEMRGDGVPFSRSRSCSFSLASARSLTQGSIDRDLHRTYPRHVYFHGVVKPGKPGDAFGENDHGCAVGQRQLRNLLSVYSVLDPDVGYCQGMAMVGGMLLFHLPEADAFAVFRHMLLGPALRLRELYMPSFARLQHLLAEFSALVQKYLPDLHKRFVAEDIVVNLFAPSWFLTLFAAVLPVRLVCRLWDFFLLRGWPVILSCALCILQWEQHHLAALDMEGVLLRLKRFYVPAEAVDTFVKCVLQAPHT